MFYLLNYVPYEKNKAMNVLKKELKWRYYGGNTMNQNLQALFSLTINMKNLT